MRFIRAICRIIFSTVFICAGMLKLIDPVGTGLIIKEYFTILHISCPTLPAVCLGTGLATLEFTIGICVLIGLKMRAFSTAALCLTLIFSAITLYLALYDPISDCGCFGQAIHLTNWQTFFKNVIILALIIIIFTGRKKATVIASDRLQWVFVALFAALGLTVSICSYIYLPQIDFTAYNVGADLSGRETKSIPEYETVFTYEKDGLREEFTLDNLPDSTWIFIESVTTGGTGSDSTPDLQLPDTEGKLFTVSIYEPDAVDNDLKARTDSFIERAQSLGVNAVILSTGDNADGKTLLTLNRSNGGITYFNEGVIAGKWGAVRLDDLELEEILDEDPDVMILRKRISEQIYLTVILISIFFIMAMMRHLCLMFRKKEDISKCIEN